MIPLYGFLEGDTLGLLILADEEETVASLARKLQQCCSVRVAPFPEPRVLFQGRTLDASHRLRDCGFEPLMRFDVVREDG